MSNETVFLDTGEYSLFTGNVLGSKMLNNTGNITYNVNNITEANKIGREQRLTLGLNRVYGDITTTTTEKNITYRFQGITKIKHVPYVTLYFYYVYTDTAITKDIDRNKILEKVVSSTDSFLNTVEQTIDGVTGFWGKSIIPIQFHANPSDVSKAPFNNGFTYTVNKSGEVSQGTTTKLESYSDPRLKFDLTIKINTNYPSKYFTAIIMYNKEDTTLNNRVFSNSIYVILNTYTTNFHIQLETFDLKLITTDSTLLDDLTSKALVSDGIPATYISIFQMAVVDGFASSSTGLSGNLYILVPVRAFTTTIDASYEVIIDGNQSDKYYLIGTGTSTNAYTSVNSGAGTSYAQTKFGHYFLLVIDKSILSTANDPSTGNIWNFKIIYETTDPSDPNASIYYDITNIRQKTNTVNFDVEITQKIFNEKNSFTYIPEKRGMLSERDIANSDWYRGLKSATSITTVKMIPT